MSFDPPIHNRRSTVTLHARTSELKKPQSSSTNKLRRVDHIKISDMSELMIKYDVGKEVGKGSFGIVLVLTDKFTEMEVAVKIIEKKKPTKREMQMIEREIQIMKMVNHPHIIYLHKVYECPKKIFLVMELCYGDLGQCLKERKVFNEIDTRKLLNDIFSAVAYLHKNDIVHRDLKLDNILLAKNPRDENDKLYTKLSDFGLSVIKGGQGLNKMLKEFCGTLQYMSPELVLNRSYSQKCDMWALGVITHLLLLGTYPFDVADYSALVDMICTKVFDFSNTNLSMAAQDLILKLLKRDPAERITANEAVHHPFTLGIPLTQVTNKPENILEMMKKWKEEHEPQERQKDPSHSSLYHIPSFAKKKTYY